ncbi:g11439 [Coccomyxa viridis]|uniref:G11439 protein n=1 Tax=Coccomyxa viridis TaxID=1274662 RepID=A0ABP1GAN2_9CHLO
MASILKATRLAPALRAYAVQRPSVYILGERSMTNFKDKERGEETVHFRKADEELLRKLLQKVKAQADSADSTQAQESAKSELQSLKGMLSKYNISDADYEAIMKWKHDV